MNFNNILFLDIETVSQYETYNHVPDDWKELWNVKAQFLIRNKKKRASRYITAQGSMRNLERSSAYHADAFGGWGGPETGTQILLWQ